MSSQLASLLFKVQLWEEDARNARDYVSEWVCVRVFVTVLAKFSFRRYLLCLVDISPNYECD